MHWQLMALRAFCFLSLVFVFQSSVGVAQQDWKQAQLDKLKGQLNATSDRAQREELEAQRNWLQSWSPGKMSVSPVHTRDVPGKRTEPDLKSKTASRFRRLIGNMTDHKDVMALLRKRPFSANEPAVLQAYLHWLDDLPPRRKKHLDEIERVSTLLIQSLVPSSESDDELVRQFTRYRRARALVYRELPDVVQNRPIKDARALNMAIDARYRELLEDAGAERTEFVLLEIRMQRRAGNCGIALSILEKFQGCILKKWYLKKRRDLLRELGWEHPRFEAAKIYADQYPDEVANEEAR